MNNKENESAKEYLSKRYKTQNDKIKENYDRISVVLPKGTKEKIKELAGLSCNAYINNLVMADLERLERQQNDIHVISSQQDPEPTPELAPKIDKAAETIEELNARLMAEREKRGIKTPEPTEESQEPPKKRKPLPWQDIPRGIMSEYLEQN